MKFGVHISTAGDIVGTPARAHAMGAEALQLFTGSPRTWRQASYSDEQAAGFKAALADFNMPCYTHMMYLTAYASDNPELRQKSTDVAKLTLETAGHMGITGVVTHMGSHKGKGVEAVLDTITDSLKQVLTADGSAMLLLENSAGSGGNIGRSFEELAMMYEALGKPDRVGFCLDTAHLLGSGYDIRTPEGWSDTLDQFDKLIGLNKLELLHLNDSKVDLGSLRDRHDNIGDGYIGYDGFRGIVNEPRVKDLVGILEVPGVEGGGPDKANLDRLKELIG